MIRIRARGDPGLQELGGLRVGDGAVVEEGAGEDGFGISGNLVGRERPILLFQVGVVDVDLGKSAGLDQGAEVLAYGGERAPGST